MIKKIALKVFWTYLVEVIRLAKITIVNENWLWMSPNSDFCESNNVDQKRSIFFSMPYFWSLEYLLQSDFFFIIFHLHGEKFTQAQKKIKLQFGLPHGNTKNNIQAGLSTMCFYGSMRTLISLQSTSIPRLKRILVPGKNRVTQNSS